MMRLVAALLMLPLAAAAQPAGGAMPPMIALQPGEGSGQVWIAPRQVVRIGRAEGQTVIDTAAWVQQRSAEPIEAVAHRIAEAGQPLVALTDLSGQRIWLAADRIVLVRASQDRHAAGARAAIVLVGLRFGTDVAVRESVAEVMAALGR